MATGLIGNHGFYRKLAAGVSFYAVGATYALFSFAVYHWRHESWVFEPKVLLGVGAFALAFAAFSYFQYLLLDGHFSAKQSAAHEDEKQIIPLP